MRVKECRVKDMVDFLVSGGYGVTLYVGEQEYFFQDIQDMVATYMLFLESVVQEKDKEYVIMYEQVENRKNKKGVYEDRMIRYWFIDRVDYYNIFNEKKNVTIAIRKNKKWASKEERAKEDVCFISSNEGSFLDKIESMEKYILANFIDGENKLKYKEHKGYTFREKTPYQWSFV